ncbi:MAG TPA: methylated-DNA--[protein]-cysteine S-methyltransferase [Limnochordales bacterium]
MSGRGSVTITPRGSVTIATPLGPVEIRGSERGVSEIRYTREQPGARFDAEAPGPVRQAAAQLTEYFAGRRTRFDFPLDLQGTPFQQAVWECLLSIPFGETRTYGWVAHAVGRPRAARAVGQAVGQNPVAIVVPCHRVVASGGKLGGYTGGLDIKRYLLRLEGLEELAL